MVEWGFRAYAMYAIAGLRSLWLSCQPGPGMLVVLLSCLYLLHALVAVQALSSLEPAGLWQERIRSCSSLAEAQHMAAISWWGVRRCGRALSRPQPSGLRAVHAALHAFKGLGPGLLCAFMCALCFSECVCVCVSVRAVAAREQRKGRRAASSLCIWLLLYLK